MLISIERVKRAVQACASLEPGGRAPDQIAVAINAIAVAVVANEAAVCIDLGNGHSLHCTVVPNGPRAVQ